MNIKPKISLKDLKWLKNKWFYAFYIKLLFNYFNNKGNFLLK